MQVRENGTDMRETFLISDIKLSEIRRKECYSVESRETQGTADETLTYIGSRILNSGRVYDYYEDEQGRFWYKLRHRMQNGKIVSMEEYIFGHKNLTKKRHRQ